MDWGILAVIVVLLISYVVSGYRAINSIFGALEEVARYLEDHADDDEIQIIIEIEVED